MKPLKEIVREENKERADHIKDYIKKAKQK